MSVFEVKLLREFIDHTALRNNVISRNIANIGTENYRREEVVFNSILAENTARLKTTDSKHLPSHLQSGESIIVTNKDDGFDSGINNVNIDEEMSELAKNSIQFKFASQKIGSYFRTLQSVIKGRGEY